MKKNIAVNGNYVFIHYNSVISWFHMVFVFFLACALQICHSMLDINTHARVIVSAVPNPISLLSAVCTVVCVCVPATYCVYPCASSELNPALWYTFSLGLWAAHSTTSTNNHCCIAFLDHPNRAYTPTVQFKRPCVEQTKRRCVPLYVCMCV